MSYLDGQNFSPGPVFGAESEFEVKNSQALQPDEKNKENRFRAIYVFFELFSLILMFLMFSNPFTGLFPLASF